MASKAKRLYWVRRTRWEQRPLLYGDLLTMIRLLRGRWKLLSKEQPSIASIIDELDADGTLPQLVDMFLRPHEPTFMHRWWNSFWMRRAGYERGQPVLRFMDTPTAARVIADFFVVNWNWYDELMNSKLGSRSLFRRRMTVAETIMMWTNFYTATRAASIGIGSGSATNLLSMLSGSSSPPSASAPAPSKNKSASD